MRPLALVCNVWKLQVNLTKTKVINFSRRCKQNIESFKIGNNPLEVVHSYKYLVFIVTPNGSFTNGIADLVLGAEKSFTMQYYALRSKIHFEYINNLPIFSILLQLLFLFCSAIYSHLR